MNYLWNKLIAIRGEEHNKKSQIKPLGLKINLNLRGLTIKKDQKETKNDDIVSNQKEILNTKNSSNNNIDNYGNI